MNALRSAAARCHVHVRMSRPPTPLANAYWHQATVRPGPPSEPSFLFPSSCFLPRPRLAPPRCCTFRQIAQQSKGAPQSNTSTESSPPPPKGAITNAEQRKRDWAIVRRLVVHIWPKDDWATRGRVVLGVGLLISGKVRSLGRFVRSS